MGKLKTTLLCALVAPAFIYGQDEIQLKGQWDGTITYSHWYAQGQSKEYVINFSGETKGTTLTEWENGHMEMCNFQTENISNRIIRITEFAKAEEDRKNICYFDAELSHKIVGDKQYLTGNFTSKYKNGTPCSIKGEMMLIQDYYPSEIVKAGNDMSYAQRLAENSSNVEAYPNPTQGQLNINLSQASFVNENVSLQIVNAQGQVVLSNNIQSSVSQTGLNLEEYENGVYMIRIMDGDELYAQKRIVLHK